MFKTPIIFLTYKRPKETKKILDIILSLKPKNLYIFQDGKKKEFSKIELKNHNDTKSVIESGIKNKKVKVVFFKKNLGQKLVGYKMMKHVFNLERECIIIEDDCVPKKFFFKYCSEMLKRFKNSKDIAHISGCNLFYGVYKKKVDKHDIFFSKYPHFMGWATWRDRWQRYYDPNIKDWPKNKDKFLSKSNLKSGEKRFFKNYLDKIYKNPKLSVWDIQWLYYNIFHNLKTIVPNVNLIKNVGFDNAPTGQSAKKFRNLFTKDLKLPIKKTYNSSYNAKYDNFLYDSFYNRKFLLFRIFNKLKYKIKYF